MCENQTTVQGLLIHTLLVEFKLYSPYLRIDGLLLQDGQDAHGLLEEVDALGEVHAKVHGLPLDALAHVLLLLEHEHVVVEELQAIVEK